jgi:hypothetical protein
MDCFIILLALGCIIIIKMYLIVKKIFQMKMLSVTFEKEANACIIPTLRWTSDNSLTGTLHKSCLIWPVQFLLIIHNIFF